MRALWLSAFIPLLACGPGGLDAIPSPRLSVTGSMHSSQSVHGVNVEIGAPVRSSICPPVRPLDVKLENRHLTERASEGVRFNADVIGPSGAYCHPTTHTEAWAPGAGTMAIGGDVSVIVSDGEHMFSAKFGQLCAPRRARKLEGTELKPGQMVQLLVEPATETITSSSNTLSLELAGHHVAVPFSVRDSVVSFRLPEGMAMAQGDVLKSRFEATPSVVSKTLECDGPVSCTGSCAVDVQVDDLVIGEAILR